MRAPRCSGSTCAPRNGMPPASRLFPSRSRSCSALWSPWAASMSKCLSGELLNRMDRWRVLETYESFVIQGWWPDSRGITDVDKQEPRAVRPQQVAISERFDQRRMAAGRTFDPPRPIRRRQADGEHARGRERPDVRSLHRLSVARDSERPAAKEHDIRLFRSVDL